MPHVRPNPLRIAVGSLPGSLVVNTSVCGSSKPLASGSPGDKLINALRIALEVLVSSDFAFRLEILLHNVKH